MNGSQVQSFEPQTDKSFKRTVEFDIGAWYHARVINLPGDRVFVIGGSPDQQCSSTSNSVMELTKNPITGQRERTDITPMHQARAKFGVAVYPKFSQIFVAGG